LKACDLTLGSLERLGLPLQSLFEVLVGFAQRGVGALEIVLLRLDAFE
jgi:hypothetical protein